jgi:hypothetical protein
MNGDIPSGETYKKLWKDPPFIVSFPMKKCDFPIVM